MSGRGTLRGLWRGINRGMSGEEALVVAIPDYSDITLFWRCEALQMGAGDTYGTDSLWSASSAAAINTAAAYSGTNGLDCPSSGDAVGIDNNAEYMTTSSAGRIAFWIRVVNWVDESGVFGADMAGSDGLVVWFSTTDGELYIRWTGGDSEEDSFTTSGAGLNSGAWKFVEIAWDATANTMECWVDNVSVGSYASAMSAWSGATGTITFGENRGVSGSDYHMDTIIISTNATQSLYGLRTATSAP